MGIDGMRMGGNGNVRIHSRSSLVQSAPKIPEYFEAL